MALPSASSELVKILRKLRNEKDENKRQDLVDLGRQALLKWFSMGARNMINGSLPLTKPTQNYVKRNFELLKTLADRHSSADEKRQIILRRGGAGFLGGIIIRTMLQWPQREPNRQKYYTIRSKKSGGYKTGSPQKSSRRRRAPKKAAPKKKKTAAPKAAAAAAAAAAPKAAPQKKKKSPQRKKKKTPQKLIATPVGFASADEFQRTGRATFHPLTSTPLSAPATTALQALNRQIGLPPHLQAMLPLSPQPGPSTQRLSPQPGPSHQRLSPQPGTSFHSRQHIRLSPQSGPTQHIRYAPGRKNVKFTARKKLGDRGGPWKMAKRV